MRDNECGRKKFVDVLDIYFDIQLLVIDHLHLSRLQNMILQNGAGFPQHVFSKYLTVQLVQ